jgi:uncharacterized protein YhjY with autotransporter beta-barrel domain
MVLTRFFCTSVSLLALGSAASAQSFTTPNVTTVDAPSSVSLNGISFTNQGLVGSGRLPAATRDFLGDSLGSFSGLAIDPYSWRLTSTGFAATMIALPDRGYNDPAAIPPFSDYAGRLLRFQMAFAPYTGANLAAATTSQNQVQLTPDGGTVLRDNQGRPFTGFDPGTGTTTVFGQTVGSPPAGVPGAGRIALDAEAITFKLDRSFYVSDEYGPSIFYFDANGNLKGSLGVPSALLPRTAGALNFNSVNPPDTGRRNNQGFEALGLTPDGNKLAAILQSATVQDTNGANQQTRNNARILMYDVANNPTPNAPVASYVVQLPTFTAAGNGTATNRTAAQSEMIAINGTQFLMLARDNGAGQGVPAGSPIVTKSIYLVDISQATNIAGTAFETTAAGQVSPNGVLNPAITPARTVEVINMLNTPQLARFGLNLNNGAPGQGPQTALTISEKWEGMALVPTLQRGRPNDFYLFVSNDNDFVTTNGSMQGVPYNAGSNNDNMILVYQLTLPTAVDPLFLAAMRETAPIVLARLGLAGVGAGQVAASSVAGQLQAMRRAGTPGWAAAGPSVWVGGRLDLGSSILGPDANANRTIGSGTVGFDYAWQHAHAGIAATVQGGRFGNSRSGIFDIAPSVTPTLYAAYFGDTFYAHGSAGFTPGIRFTSINRPGAYGLIGTGDTKADIYSFDGEAGLKFLLNGYRVTPFIGLTHIIAEINGYTEDGAAGGNIVYPKHSVSATTLRVGGELATTINQLTPSLRVAYNHVLSPETRLLNVSLDGVLNPMATQSVAVPRFDGHSVTVGLGLQGDLSPTVGWRVGYDAALATRDGALSHGLTAGIRIGL